MQVLAVPWVQLPGQQNILVQVVFNESDYAVRVTDLQNIWGEDLNRKAIQARANEVDCPIDAEGNLVDLLKKLQDALTVDAASTSIVLKREHDTLTLTTVEKIASTQLEWLFRLTALPFSAVATGLTLSLFSMMTFYQRGIQSLLTVLEDKDAVIRQMNEFMKTANLTFKPNRRQKAFYKFSKSEWLDSCREKAGREQVTSQEVVDSLSLHGREADFRKDWRAVLSNVGKWEIKFLPDTTERTPGRVTSSIKARVKSSIVHDPFANQSVLAREDTESQGHVFLSPRAKRIKDKNKIHTKWSSPVSSSHKSSDNGKESDDSFEDDQDKSKLTPKARRSESIEASPTLKQSKRVMQLPQDDLTLPIYKLRDNRESQQLEEDLDMATSSSDTASDKSVPKPSSPAAEPTIQPIRGTGSDDTTEGSDEDLDAAPQHKNASKKGSAVGPDNSSSARPSLKRDSSNDSESSTKSRKSQISNAPSRRSASEQPSAASTPSKPRILNFISPKKHSKDSAASGRARSPAAVSRESSEEDSQVIDLEAQRKRKAMEKRKEAEALMKAPAKKRARKF